MTAPNYSPRWPLGQYAALGVPYALQPQPDDSGITAPSISAVYFPPVLTGSSYAFPPTSAAFLYSKAAIGVAANPNYVQRSNNNVGNEASAFEVSFMFDGIECEIELPLSNTMELVYLVNGIQVGAIQPVTTYGGSTTWSQTLTFAARGPKYTLCKFTCLQHRKAHQQLDLDR